MTIKFKELFGLEAVSDEVLEQAADASKAFRGRGRTQA